MLFSRVSRKGKLAAGREKSAIPQKRPNTIIDTETTEEIKPNLYYDEETNEVKGKCTLQADKTYVMFEIRDKNE